MNQPCPSCGYCPTCGRSSYHQPYWYRWNQPYWLGNQQFGTAGGSYVSGSSNLSNASENKQECDHR